MQVRDAMTTQTLTVGPGHSLRDAATAMAERATGAAIVIDPEAAGPGIITERDVLRAVAKGHDPESELVGDHLTARVVYATPDWSLDDAARAMTDGAFRHLVVTEDGEVVGMISVRDIVRAWVEQGAPVGAQGA